MLDGQTTVECSVASKTVKVSEIPDVAGLKASIGLCKDVAGESEKASAFFDRAETVLSKDKVSILQFTDTNTTGVTGPCENGSPYFALLKARGQSVKATGVATGSYGIGKFAPFTLSQLRTVFITTVWEDANGILQHYVQGKSILMSHYDGDDTRRGTGFWGLKERCQPLIGLSDEVPTWLRREKDGKPVIGTTVTVLAFDDTRKGWANIIAASIAESFFSAIARGTLRVSIADNIVLSKNNLSDFFVNESVHEAIKIQEGQPDRFIRSGYYLESLGESDEVFAGSTQNGVFGHMQLKILVREGLPKRVAVTRNGMLITSRLPGLKRLNEFKGFVAVLECLSDKGNKILRDMEPPAHDAFEPQRLSDQELQKKARRELNTLARWVRAQLKRFAQNPISEVTAIDELAELFPDSDTDEDNKDGTKEGENPRGKITIRSRPIPIKKATSFLPPTPTGGEDEGGDDESGPEGDNDSSGGQPTSGGGKGDSESEGQGNSKPSQQPFEIANFRAIPVASNRRRISFTPVGGGQVKISLAESGADYDRQLPMSSSSTGSIQDGNLIITCAALNRISVEVELGYDFDGAIKVAAYAI